MNRAAATTAEPTRSPSPRPAGRPRAARAGQRGVVLYWSGGKDCAVALHEIRTLPRYRGYAVASLVTTFTDGYDRVSGHGVRRALIERQAACLGLDLLPTYIPRAASMTDYETVMERALRGQRRRGAEVAASGDIFVEKQRLAIFKRVGLNGCFPLCRRDSRRHAEALIAHGFKALVVCVDGTALDASFAGRMVDAAFLRDLPPGVDPCGEHGEFHTFVFDGPIFHRPVACRLGEVVFRQGFYFCDLLADDPRRPAVERS
jgi:uncharacterized protein (TIGR00290 family)